MVDSTIRINVDPSRARDGARVIKRDLNDIDGAAGKARRGVAALTTALGAIGGVVVFKQLLGEIAAFESGLIGVGKTTGIAGQQLQSLGDQVREIGERVPVATTELLSLAQSAGQLGVKGSDNIARFTETVGKLGIASDLAGEQAATAFARILTVTGTPISEVDRLGSAIVQLGNNFAATESEIAGAATRVAQSTSQFGVSAGEVLGIGTALRAVGVEAEAGGTQIGLAFQSINDSIRAGGEQMEALQRITGQTSEQLRESFFGGESTQVFAQFVEGLGRIQDSGGDVASVLEEFDLKGVRAVQVLGTLATRSEVLSDALGQANQGYEENIALNEEAETASESLNAQLQLLRNAFSNLLTDTDVSTLTDSLEELSDILKDEEVKEGAQGLVQFMVDLSKEAVIAARDLGGLIEEIKQLLDIDTETGNIADLSVEYARLKSELVELEKIDASGVAANLLSPFGQNAEDRIAAVRDRIGEIEDELLDIPEAAQSVAGALDSLGEYGILTDYRAPQGLSQVPLIFRETGDAADDAADGVENLSDAQEEAAQSARRAEQSYADLRDELALESEVLQVRLEQGDQAADAFREEAQLRERLNELIAESSALTQEDSDAVLAELGANRELREEIERRDEAERGATRAAEREARERQRLAEREAEAFQRPFDRAAENIQRSFGDTFTEIYRGGTDIFEDFAGTIKDIFARLAGEITALFLTRGLGQLLGVGGGISVSGSALASGGGLLGELGGGLGGLTDLAASIPGIGQIVDVAQAFQAGFQNTGLSGGFQAAIDQSFLSAPTSVGGGLLAAGAGGFGGYTAGNFLNSLGLTQGGGTGSGIGGGIGGAIGSFAGPIGTAVGSVGGSFIGGGIEELLSGETFADRVTGALDAFFPGVGSILDGVLSGFESLFGSGGDLINVAPVTTDQTIGQRPGELGGIEAGLLRDGPFGSVGLSRDYGRGEIPGDVIRNLTQSVASFDQQVSEFLTQGQIGDVSSFLQSQDIGLGQGAGSGTGFGQGVDDEDIADLLANRFSQIFDALDLRLPEVVEKATRNKLEDLGISTEQVLEAGLAPLAQIQAQREAAAQQVRSAVGVGESQTIQDVFDELNIATDQLPRTSEELRAFVEGLGEAEQAGLAPIIGQLQQFVSTSEQAQQQIKSQALAVQREFGLADSAFQDYLQTLGTSTDQLPQTEQGLRDFIAGLDEAEQAGLQPFIGELRALVQVSGEAADATQTAAEAARIAARGRELEVELLRAQGKEEKALAAERQLQIEKTPEQLRAIQEQIFAARDQTEAQREAAIAAEEQAAAEQRLADQRQSLEVQLARAQGNDSLARDLQRESTLAGLPEQLRDLQREIFDAEDAAREQAQAEREAAQAKREAEAQAREAAQLASQRSRLEIELLRAKGDEEQALVAERERQIAQLPESLRAIQEQIFAEQDAAQARRESNAAAEEQARIERQIAEQRQSLEIQLARAQGNDRLARELEREQILSDLPDALLELQQAVFDAEDTARRSAEAERRREQAELEAERRREEARRQAERLAEQRSRLEIELLRAQGDEQAALNLERQRQLDSLPEELRALQEQVFAANDAAEAQRELARAQEEAAQRAREAARFTDDIETRLAASQLSGTDLELFRLDNEFDDLREQANELGVDLADIEELYAVRRTEILEQAAQEQQQVVEQGVQDATATLREAYDRQASELESTVERFTGFGESLRAFREELVGGDIARLTGQQRLERERSQFAEVAQLASLGDEQALQNIERAGREFLEASSDVNATSSAFFADRDRVLQAIESATGAADFEADLAQSQLDTLREQVSELITINESVVSVEEAIQQFQGAQSALGGVTESSDTPTITIQQPPNQQAQQQRNTDSLIAELRTSNAELRQQNEHLAATVRVLQAGFRRTTEQGEQIVENTGETARAARLETS